MTPPTKPAGPQLRGRHSRPVIVAGIALWLLIFALLAGTFFGSNSQKTSPQQSPPFPENTAPMQIDPEATDPTQSMTVPDGADGFAVVVGDKNADVTVTLYEDLHCPVCSRLEQQVGANLTLLAEQGVIRVEHRPLAILNAQSTTYYSSRAANAYASVLHTGGVEKADRFRTLLYINQPTEGTDGLSDDDLVEIAGLAGADENKVRPLIEDLAFLGWVEQGTVEAVEQGLNSTPRVFVNGKRVKNPFSRQLPNMISKAAGQPVR